jgi:hypothetical protein
MEGEAKSKLCVQGFYSGPENTSLTVKGTIRHAECEAYVDVYASSEPAQGDGETRAAGDLASTVPPTSPPRLEFVALDMRRDLLLQLIEGSAVNTEHADELSVADGVHLVEPVATVAPVILGLSGLILALEPHILVVVFHGGHHSSAPAERLHLPGPDHEELIARVDHDRRTSGLVTSERVMEGGQEQTRGRYEQVEMT